MEQIAELNRQGQGRVSSKDVELKVVGVSSNGEFGSIVRLEKPIDDTF